MPGKVLSISANPGQSVKKGETILVFEAMKMENSVVAPEDGTVASIAVSVGDSFEAGAVKLIYCLEVTNEHFRYIRKSGSSDSIF